MRLFPNTEITVYKNVHIDDGVRIVWQSEANRDAYFERHKVASFKSQIKRKGGSIKFPLKLLNGELLEDCNYLSFHNKNYDNIKWYARIIDVDYINNETAAISYAIDRWTSRMFKVRFNECGIEREHMSKHERDLVNANPYHQDIQYMRTPEMGLPYSPSLQKRRYYVGGINSPDACMVFNPDGIDSVGSYNIVYVSPINFDDLTDLKNWWDMMLVTLREPAVTGGAHTPGFYFEPDNDTGVGNVGTGNSATSPYWGNMLAHPYWVIGFYNNGSYPAPDYTPSKLIEKLTASGLQDCVLGIYTVPDVLIYSMTYLKRESGATIATRFTMETNGYKAARSDYTHVDPKLGMFPFAYMKVTGPDGQSKEYHYEKFGGNISGNQGETFFLSGDLAEKPKMAIQPDDYDYVKGGTSTNRQGNPFEEFMYDKFPTVAYTVDAWTAQMAALAASHVANYNAENALALQESEMLDTGLYATAKNFAKNIGGAVVGGAGDVLGAGASLLKLDVGGAVGSLGNAAGRVMSAPENIYRDATAAEQQEIRNEEFRAAGDLLRGNANDNAIYKNFSASKPAYAANIYNKSNGDGVINYNVVNMLDIMVTHVRLSFPILYEYTKYFDCFGYNAQRIGIPYVIKYRDGDSEWCNEWRELDGNKSTYIKTVNCSVVAPEMETAREITMLFDAGVRMLKGEELA